MGMFDYIRCEFPFPGDSRTVYQTKDTPSQFMDTYVIGTDGALRMEVCDFEDRSDPEAEGIAALFGVMTRVPTGEWREVVDFHQDLVFYNRDREFKARFTDGRCVWVKETTRGPAEGETSSG